jgi:hypothetical protein
MLGGSADGRGSSGAIPEFAGVAADAASGMPLAVPATATLVRNLRRSTPPRDSLVRRFFMSFLSSCLRRRHAGAPPEWSKDAGILSRRPDGGKGVPQAWLWRFTCRYTFYPEFICCAAPSMGGRQALDP